MKKKIYYLSIIFTSLVFIFLFIKALGFIFWINGAPIDKWVAWVSLFAIPTFIYYSFPGQNFKKTQKAVTIMIIIVQVIWLKWAINQLKYYVYINNDNILPSPYIIQETPNSDIPISLGQRLLTDYTFYKSINSYLYVKENVTESDRGIVDWIKHFDSKIKEEKDGRIYIETYKGKLFFK
ncbi:MULTISPECIES: hypothetical protein [Bacillus cereus group]|uniref:Uncharacterized protein n=1 Tax=Bacillus wiedmannii TaxID=1890302 RepID=A0A242Z271_9BACI|nr:MULTISPECIES: hypothetical protein [Bacillus cereus group]OUB51887.1 hypothetical protein BK740_00355 [Bacillus thuringiensis serovar argentinensis]MED2693816.1 hypothetical protein [Bacillus toyonensis]MED3126851.1 hypothetical protein [Bacillus wiedmannii]OKO50566.1 hypothetical protein ABH17_028985 [Bacillus toyonensis]OTX86058.1 hypothetical protein BK730_22020 [Bacillus wiedmannii]